MIEKLKPFVELQAADSARAKLRRGLEGAMKRRDEARKAVEISRLAERKSAERKLASDAALGASQLKLKIAEEGIAKLDRQLSNTSSAREFEALKTRLGGAKADASLVEDEILAAMEVAEAARKEHEAAAGALAAETARSQKIDAEVMAEAGPALDELAALDARASEIEKRCDRDLLPQYKALLGRRAGVAIAPIVDRLCQGCYTSITIQEQNQLLGGTISSCSSCQRIIYLP